MRGALGVLLRPLVIGALMAVVVLSSGSEALAGTLLRWKLEPADCLLLEVEQQGADKPQLAPQKTRLRTIYGADFADGWQTAHPAGRLADVIYRYVTLLPEKEVGSKASWQLREEHKHLGAQEGGVLRVQGSGRLSKRGSVFRIEHELALKGSGKAPAGNVNYPQAITDGALRTRAHFHARKGLLVDAEVELAWTDPKGNRHEMSARFRAKEVLEDDPAALGHEVNAAIERALTRHLIPYLKAKRWSSQGSQQLGHMALMLYAALKAGLPVESPVAREALAQIETLPWTEVYSVALAILALEATGMRRVDGDRGGASRPRFRKEDLGDTQQRLLAKLTRWLLDAQIPGRGDWHYKPPGAEQGRPTGQGDNSNTQFAVLALHAARRSNVPVPPEIWARIAQHFLKGQATQGPPVRLELERESGARVGDPQDALGPSTVSRGGNQQADENGARARGSGYGQWPNGQMYASMTSACVSSMLVAHKWLIAARAEDKLILQLRLGIRDGYAWLQRNHSMRHNWPHQGWPYYHLYSMEKAFEIGEVARIGGHDWWAEGARELLLREDKQRGGWSTEVHTALAVLFLTRATAEPELEIDPIERAQTGGPEVPDAEDAVAVDGLGVVRVTEVIRALETKDARKRAERLDLLAQAWEVMERERRPICCPELARALGSRYREVRRRAEELLEEIAGERIADEDAAAAFFGAWQQIRALGQTGGGAAVAGLRARLTPEQAPGLRRAAALWLSRLRAVEAIPDLIDELDRARDVEDRKLFHGVLIALAGSDPGYDPEAAGAERKRGIDRWRELWEREGRKLMQGDGG
jgi:hypothetical protein